VIGGFNGTDPAPTLEEFKRYVADKQIHYFIRGRIMIGGALSGSREAAPIAEWVENHYTPISIVDDATRLRGTHSWHIAFPNRRHNRRLNHGSHDRHRRGTRRRPG
jgi:hypothetical protein